MSSKHKSAEDYFASVDYRERRQFYDWRFIGEVTTEALWCEYERNGVIEPISPLPYRLSNYPLLEQKGYDAL